MARSSVEVKANVGGQNVLVRVLEFPIIEDLILQLSTESVFARRMGEPMSPYSPIGRDLKDSIIKTNVVRG